MRIAIIVGGKVDNVIEANGVEALQAVLPGEQLVEAAAASIGDAWDGAQFIAPPSPPPAVPESISPRQFRQSLSHFGFRAQVDGAISASTDQDLKDWYQFASDFQRHHPEVLAMASTLGFTGDQLDQVWIYGATL